MTVGGGGIIRGADEPVPNATSTFKQYCFQCHGGKASMAGVSLEKLTAQSSVAENFTVWERVAGVLESKRMPPKGMPQPSDADRQQAVTWVKGELNNYAKKHSGDPGRVTVRRLTSGEYAYAVQDLTGFEIDAGIDPASDSVGGEGFTNFGDVQFMQDANLERYLEAAKLVADHAVVGSGPLQFWGDAGKTGFELSAIERVKTIYAENGFRTVSGEGGIPFGLDKYTKALFVAWQFKNRATLGQPTTTIKDLAAHEGVSPRFAQHIWTVMNSSTLEYPSDEAAARWRRLPAPSTDIPASEKIVRASCEEIQKYITGYPSWLFSRGDIASGGAGDESPLIINEKSLKGEATHHFLFSPGARGGGRGRGAPTGPTKIYLNVSSVNPKATGTPVVIWKNPTVGFRTGPPPGRGGQTPAAGQAGAGGQTVAAAGQSGAGGRGAAGQTAAAGQGSAGQTAAAGQAAGAAQTAAVQAATEQAAAGQGGAGGQGAVVRRGALPTGPRKPLREVVSEETAKKLNFGTSPDGSTIGANDFAAGTSLSFEVVVPTGSTGFDFQVDATLGKDRDQAYRITITDREDGGARGIPTRTLLGDPQSAGYQLFKNGVLQLVKLLPPNSYGEPTPADKDPIPDPFDSTANVPEHDAFDTKVKYVRDDRYIYENILDDATRVRLNQAWNDVYASFEYQDNYLHLIAEHYNYDLKGKHIESMDKAQIEAMPAEARKYALPVFNVYREMVAAQAAARPGHVEDCLKFASRAWRRPLTEHEKLSLRAFYDKAFVVQHDHTAAIKALLTRILVAPEFLYRVENAANTTTIRTVAAVTPIKPLSNYELASRMSFFLWSSIPDDELRRAAAAGELSDPQQLQKQVKRMLADPKARRLATEFFGQWLGFYRFDQFKGVDTSRFPEFTNEVKSSMYDEAVSFFEYIVRKDRPVSDMLFANYDFLNQPLAKYYGVKKDIKSKDDVEKVDEANGFQRGGLLRLGAVLTTTSAPLRTSPVRRGDWVLRRVLGTAVPPPPADAGSIPADDKLFGGLSVRERLQVHKRNATCATCHSRIDPLGFPLEHYDSTGRWRDKYPDGKPIDDTSTTSDQKDIAGVTGLLDYLHSQEPQVVRTLAHKLVGYALGRTLLLSDQPLVDNLVAGGGDATFSQLVGEIVTSKQFRNRAGHEDGPTPTTTVKTAAVRATNKAEKVGER